MRNVASGLGWPCWRLLFVLAFAAHAAAPVEVLRADDTLRASPRWVPGKALAAGNPPEQHRRRTPRGTAGADLQPTVGNAEVLEAATRKPDGRIIEAGPGAVVEQLPPGSAELDHFTDRQQKMVLLPDVEPAIPWWWPGGARCIGRCCPVSLPPSIGRRAHPGANLTLTVRAPRGTKSEFRGVRLQPQRRRGGRYRGPPMAC